MYPDLYSRRWYFNVEFLAQVRRCVRVRRVWAWRDEAMPLVMVGRYGPSNVCTCQVFKHSPKPVAFGFDCAVLSAMCTLSDRP